MALKTNNWELEEEFDLPEFTLIENPRDEEKSHY